MCGVHPGYIFIFSLMRNFMYTHCRLNPFTSWEIMFNHLSERLNKVIKNLTGQGRLTESNIKDTLRDIRVALLEADVALSEVTD